MRLARTPTQRSATAVYVSLLVQFAMLTAIVIFEAVRGRRLAEELAALGGDHRSPDAQALVGAASVFAVLLLMLLAATFAAAAYYAIWLTRAAGAGGGRSLPASRVLAGWLVPGVNLVAPPLIVDRVWRSAAPQPGGRRRWLVLLYAWWLSCLGALALVLAPGGASTAEAELTGLGPVELVARAVAAVLCAATVREITALRTARRTAPTRHRTCAGRITGLAARPMAAGEAGRPRRQSPSHALISSHPPLEVSKRSS